MRAVEEIKEEHVVIREKLRSILKLFENYKSRTVLLKALNDFDKFWTKHEEKEENYFDLFLSQGGKFPYHKMLIAQHEELKGHWKVLQDFLENKNDLELGVALDTDGRMLVNKFLKHTEIEDKYFDKYFKGVK